MTSHNLHSEKGFSLIELMIVVMIIGILAAVAVPAYMSHVRKTRQVDGTHRLLDIKTAQEKFYALNDEYADELIDLDGMLNFHTTDPMFDYLISSPSGDFEINFLARSRNDLNEDGAWRDCWEIANTYIDTDASGTRNNGDFFPQPTQYSGGAAPYNCVANGEGVNISLVPF